VRASFSCTGTTSWCSGSITIPGAGRSAATENHFPFRCAPRIAGLRWALEKRRLQHFGNSWWASKESGRHSSWPPQPKEKAPHEAGPVTFWDKWHSTCRHQPIAGFQPRLRPSALLVIRRCRQRCRREGGLRGRLCSGCLTMVMHTAQVNKLPLLAFVIRGTPIRPLLDRRLIAGPERGITGRRLGVDRAGDATEHSRENKHFHFRKFLSVKNNAWDLLHRNMTGR
jgi:hypothetical protein